jgi:uncharacterized protein YutE (UPF0331/DUF86 family)
MRLDLYQAETARIASEQASLLDLARERLLANQPLNKLEQSGVLHALQVLVENAIGKAKHLIKASGAPVPVSAHDALAALEPLGLLGSASVAEWNAVIGLRNRIVHDYMNIDMALVLGLVRNHRYHFIVEFLRRPITKADAS